MDKTSSVNTGLEQTSLEQNIKLFFMVLVGIVVFSFLEWAVGISGLIHLGIYESGLTFLKFFLSSVLSQFVLLQDKFILILLAMLVFYIFNPGVMAFFWLLSLINVLILYILGVYFPVEIVGVAYDDLDVITRIIFYDNLEFGMRESISLVVMFFGFLFFNFDNKKFQYVVLGFIFLNFLSLLIFQFVSWVDVLIGGVVGWFMAFFLYVLSKEFEDFSRALLYTLLSLNTATALFVMLDSENYYFDTSLYLLLSIAGLGYSAYYFWIVIQSDITRRTEHDKKKKTIIQNMRLGHIDRI